jgi:hypothetical protein
MWLFTMRPARNSPLILGPAADDNRRHAGRVRCERLRCLFVLGTGIQSDVLDLSSTGLRVMCRHKLSVNTGDMINIVIESVAGNLALVVKVVWCKKRGFRKRELGLTFGEPTPAVRSALNQILRTSSVTNTMYKKDVA